MTTKNKKISISGRNIYQDEKGRNILYNKNTGVGYLIQDKDEKSFNTYKNRFLFVIIGVILAMNFLAEPIVCIGAGIILAAFLEFRYRKKFLPSLVQITNFKPYKNVTFIDQIVNSGQTNKVLLSAVLYVVFAILLVLNGIEMKLNNVMMIMNLALACAAVGFAGLHIVAFSKMRKLNK